MNNNDQPLTRFAAFMALCAGKATAGQCVAIMVRLDWDPVTEYLEDKGAEGLKACALLEQQGDAEERYDWRMRKARVISGALAHFAKSQEIKRH
jgi:hypothetical protein